MEKDHKIEKLIKESGLVSAPDNFTSHIMDRINSEPEKMVYKPLIGKFGKVIILLFIIGLITVSIIYSEPSGFLAEHSFNIPDWKLNFENLPKLNFSTGLLAGLVAVFILVISDVGLNRRNLI